MPTKQFGVDFDAATTPLDGTETLSIVQGGVTVDATTQDIADLASGGVTSVNGQTGVVVLALDDIDDVDVPTPTDGQVLTWVTADSEWQAVTPSGGVPDGDKGDITVTASGATWTIDSQAVTYAKMQNISATQRVLGRNTAGAGSTEEVTFTQFLDWVGSAANGDILYRSGGSWTRLPIGTNGQVLTVASSLPSWATGGGGGLTNWTEAVNTAAPNATIPVVSFTATNAATNVDAAILPKGSGAFALAIADNTSTGGNKRGTRAVDLQLSRSSAAAVASGQNSFAAGSDNTVSGTGAAVCGVSNSVSGTYATVGGQSHSVTGNYCAVFGFGNTASAQGGVATGRSSTTRAVEGAISHANGVFSSNAGEAQIGRLIERAATTDATATVASSNGSAAAVGNQITLPNNSAYAVKCTVVARQNTTGDCVMFDGSFLVKRGANAASTAIVGSPTFTQTFGDAGGAAWTVAVTANTTLGCATITVTGEAAKTIRWVVDMYACAQVMF